MITKSSFTFLPRNDWKLQKIIKIDSGKTNLGNISYLRDFNDNENKNDILDVIILNIIKEKYPDSYVETRTVNIENQLEKFKKQLLGYTIKRISVDFTPIITVPDNLFYDENKTY